MPLGTPLVSIIVPAYNAARFIAETLESALAQTYDALEILVIDDGSTDETVLIVERFARRDSRVRLLQQANAGVGAARNAGIAHARGRYIAPLDADDTWRPEKIASQVEAMESGGERLGFVYCWSRTFDPGGAETGRYPPCHACGDVHQLLVFRNFLNNASVPLFRASALAEVGGYLTRSEQGGAQGCEDWELTLRVAEKYQVAVVPEYLVGYREVPSGMSSGAAGMIRSYRCMIEGLRRRQPQISERVLGWSAGYFHLYAAKKCHQGGATRSTLSALATAARIDPALLLCPLFVRTLLGSLWRWLVPRRPELGLRAARRLALTDDRRWSAVWWTVFQRVEMRRWSSLQREGTRL